MKKGKFSRRKQLIQLGAAVVGGLAMSSAMATPANYTTAQGNVAWTAGANGETLTETLLGDALVTSGGVAPAFASTYTGIGISINTISASTGLRTTGNSTNAINSGTGSITSVALTQGTVSTDATSNFASVTATDPIAALRLSGTLAATTAVNIGATGTLTSSGASGSALLIGSVATPVAAQTVNVTNSGAITATGATNGYAITSLDPTGTTQILTVTNNAGATISAANATNPFAVFLGQLNGTGGILPSNSTSLNQLNLTNTGTIVGGITAGGHTATTIAHHGGSINGPIALGNAAQVLTLGGGTLGLNSSIDGPGLVNVTASTALGKAVGATTPVTTITVSSGQTLTAPFNINATNINGASAGIGTLAVTDNVTVTGAIGASSLAGITVAAGKTLTKTLGTYAATATTLSAGSALTSTATAHTGTIDGTISGAGTFNVNATTTVAGNIGGTQPLNAINVAAGAALTVNNNVAATATLLTDSGNLIIATDNQVYTGTINSSNALGTLNVNGNFAPVGVIGATSPLASITVANAKTLTANQNISTAATILNGATAGLNLNADGLTYPGTIAGGAASQGELTVGGNFTSQGTIGVVGGNNLNTVTVAAGKALTVAATHSIVANTHTINGTLNFGNTTTFTANTATSVTSGGTINLNGANQTIGGPGTFTVASGGILALGNKVLSTSAATTLAGTINTTLSGIGGTTAGTATGNLGQVLNSAGGAINLTNAIVNVNVASQYVPNGATYKLVAGNTGMPTLTGATAASTGILTWGISANTFDTILTATRTPMNTIPGMSGTTGAAFAAAVEANAAAATGDALTVLGYFQTLPTARLVSEAQLSTPKVNGGAVSAASSMQASASGNVATRLGGASGTNWVMSKAGMSNMAFAFLGGGLPLMNFSVPVSSKQMAVPILGVSQSQTGSNGLEVWGRLIGNKAKQQMRENIDGYHQHNFGLTLGMDSKITDSLKLGFAVSKGQGKILESDGLASYTDLKSNLVNFYGSYNITPKAFVDVNLGAGRHKYNSNRGTALSRIATADYQANQSSIDLSSGYHCQFDDQIVFTPTVNVSGSRLRQDAYTETGASSLNMSPDAMTVNSLQAGLGGKLSMAHEIKSGLVISPQISAGWMHELVDKKTTLDVTSAGFGAYSIQDLKPQKDIFNVGLGFAVKQQEDLTVSLLYNATMKARYLDHTGMLKLNYAF